jgi:hypothetical protein
MIKFEQTKLGADTGEGEEQLNEHLILYLTNCMEMSRVQVISLRGKNYKEVFNFLQSCS